MEKQKTFIRMFLIMLAITICTTTMLASCKEEPILNSAWRDREIRVDGDDSDWQGCPHYYDENTRSVISILNDEGHLYVRLSSHDLGIQRQMMVQGFTLWLEQQGENPKKIGVHFPVGLPREERRPFMFGAPSGDAPGPDEQPPGERSEAFRDPPREGPRHVNDFHKMEQREIQLLGPGEYEQKTMPLADIKKYDIDVTVNQTPRGLVYELKVPITRSKEIRYALLNTNKEGFRLGLQAGDMEEKGIQRGTIGQQTSDGREGREAGMGPPRGGEGGRPGGRSGPASAGKGEKGERVSLRLWLKIPALAERTRDR